MGKVRRRVLILEERQGEGRREARGRHRYGFARRMMGFCTKNHGFCPENDGLCTENGEFCLGSGLRLALYYAR